MAKKEAEAKAENYAADCESMAETLHNDWVRVSLTAPNVDQSNQLLCTWDLLPDADKERYRKLVADVYPAPTTKE